MKFIVRTLLLMGVNAVFLPSAHGQVKPAISAANPSALEQKARKLYERLTGTKLPIDSPEIQKIVEQLNAGNKLAAAAVATSDPNFYNITVKLFALEMSTREETIKTTLNDFAASFIGVTRDQTDARELLTGNFYYRGASTLPATIRANLVTDILRSNNHYADLETNRINLFSSLTRVEGQQIANTASTSVANPDPAGVLTSLSFMGAHALMGTNRRLVEYSFKQFMCVPLTEWADANASDSRIGRDIDRFPAGDHNKFLTSCKGCHTVMDGFRGAFAKWDFDGRGLKHSSVNPRNANASMANLNIDADANGVVAKMNKNNEVFPSGYVMTNDSWVNNANRATNASLFEWRGPASSGNGVNSLGNLIANSRRFSQCMALRAFKTVCRKNLDPVQNKALLKQWGDEFEASGYRLKNLFETISTKPECLN